MVQSPKDILLKELIPHSKKSLGVGICDALFVANLLGKLIPCRSHQSHHMLPFRSEKMLVHIDTSFDFIRGGVF